MARKLIVLSDGTGNSAAKLFKTNVWKLYEALDLTPSSDQIALYDDGVGTSRFRPWALLTGAFGIGLKRNVLKMYVFLSRHYHNEVEAQRQANPTAKIVPPDIYGFGFSRGAFTIRVLAGLVLKQGLVPRGSESEMHRMALLSYRAYRKKSFHTKFHIEDPFRNARDAIARLVDRAWHHLDYDPNKSTPDGKPSTAKVRINTGVVEIRFLGLWDTVAAYGMPIEELRVAIDKLIFPLTFTNTELLPRVGCARHALSIDDERSSFAPLLWDHVDEDRLKQVWFTGMHANVGGGYPDDSQSSVPLAWIAFEAENKGLLFNQHALEEIRGRATPYGKMYDSRAGFGSFYRYQPRQARCQVAGVTVPAPPLVHESVVFRMATGFQGYAPIALLHDVKVVDKKGVPHDFVAFQKLAREGRERFEAMAATKDIRLATMVDSLTPPRCDRVQRVQEGVLQRRFAYFGMLLPTLALLAFPLVGTILPAQPWTDEEWVKGAPGQIAGWVSALVPGYLTPWLTAFARNPGLATVLVTIAVIAYFINSTVSREIVDRARAAWNIGGRNVRSADPSLFDTIARWLLNSSTANTVWDIVRSKAFPLVVLGGFGVFVVASVDRTAFWLKSSSGKICKSKETGGSLAQVTSTPRKIEFNANSRCQATGLALYRDQKYQIGIVLPEKGWTDGKNAADLPGLDFSKLSWADALIMRLGAPLRRHPTEAWFVPIARVGNYGSDEYVLRSTDVVGGDLPRRKMTSIITPRTSGELFLFVNDAYSGLFPLAWLEPGARDFSGGWARHLYGNNHGTATVTVTRLHGLPK